MKKAKVNSVEETTRKLNEKIGVVGRSDEQQPYLAVFKQPAASTAYGSNTQEVSFEAANIKSK